MVPEFACDEDLLDRLTARPHELVYLVGSALTAPARAGEPGVPRVDGVIELIREEYQRPNERQRFEAALAAEPDNRYQTAFRYLLRTRDQDVANAVIRRAVLLSRRPSARFPSVPEVHHERLCRELEDDLDGWHLPPAAEALGRVLAEIPPAARPLVLTSNFDPLVAISVRRARGGAYTTALHGDGSLAGVDGQGCLVVHFHGDWFRTDTLHTRVQLGQERPKLAASLAQLISSRTLVVLGYGGWDDVFTRSLIGVIRGGLAPIKVAWAFYSHDEAAITRDSTRLLGALQPGIELGRVVLYKGIDAHNFLPRFAARLTDLAAENAAARESFAGDEATQVIVPVAKTRFTFEEKLGSGGFAEVYAATDNILRRRVAIKLFNPGGTDISSALNHAQALARIRHNNVVTIFEITSLPHPVDQEERNAIVMEYLGGKTLAKLLCGPPLERDQADRLCTGIIAGLKALHEEGIVHSDLHDENIQLDARGVPKIIDVLYRGTLAQIPEADRKTLVRQDVELAKALLGNILAHSSRADAALEFRRLAVGSSSMDEIAHALERVGSLGLSGPGQVSPAADAVGVQHASREVYAWTLLGELDLEGARGEFAAVLDRDEGSPVARLGLAVWHGMKVKSPTATQWERHLVVARQESVRRNASVDLLRGVALWWGLFRRHIGASDAEALGFLKGNFGPAAPYIQPLEFVVRHLQKLKGPAGPGTTRETQRPIGGRGGRKPSVRDYIRLGQAMTANVPLPTSDPLWKDVSKRDVDALWNDATDEPSVPPPRRRD